MRAISEKKEIAFKTRVKDHLDDHELGYSKPKDVITRATRGVKVSMSIKRQWIDESIADGDIQKWKILDDEIKADKVMRRNIEIWQCMHEYLKKKPGQTPRRTAQYLKQHMPQYTGRQIGEAMQRAPEHQFKQHEGTRKIGAGGPYGKIREVPITQLYALDSGIDIKAPPPFSLEAPDYTGHVLARKGLQLPAWART